MFLNDRFVCAVESLDTCDQAAVREQNLTQESLCHDLQAREVEGRVEKRMKSLCWEAGILDHFKNL